MTFVDDLHNELGTAVVIVQLDDPDPDWEFYDVISQNGRAVVEVCQRDEVVLLDGRYVPFEDVVNWLRESLDL